MEGFTILRKFKIYLLKWDQPFFFRPVFVNNIPLNIFDGLIGTFGRTASVEKVLEG